MLAIDSIRFQGWRHTPYGPDMGLMDIRVYIKPKSHLRNLETGKIFVTETMKIVSYFDKQFYIDIYNKWIHRHMTLAVTT